MKYALLIAILLGAQLTFAQYSERKGAESGSKIAPIHITSPWPLDKHFSDFTPEEQQRYKASHYEGMPADETPPFPLAGLAGVRNEIENTARGRVMSWPRGRVFAIVTVSKDGEAQKVEVYESPSDDISKITSYVLMNTEYSPADCQGEVCQGEYLWLINYAAPK